MPVLLLSLLSAPALMGLLLWMERVERSLPSDTLISDLLVLLDSAEPEEIELLVSQELARALAPSVRRRVRSRRVAERALLPGQPSGFQVV